MSNVYSAKELCERALRAIGAFPVTDSAADGEQLREAMTWLDLILAENAGINKLLFLIPSPTLVQFTITNGTGAYDLIAALGANAPVDGVQFPVAAYLSRTAGNETVASFASVPDTIILGLTATDLTTPANIPDGTTVVAVNYTTGEVTLSAPCAIQVGDSLQFSTAPSPTDLIVTAIGQLTNYRRHPIPLVKRDEFMATHNPAETGPPRMVYIDRLPDSQLYIFPTPQVSDPSSYILELDVQTYAPNVAPAGVTGTQPQGSVLTNFRQSWQRYLIAQLSHDLGCGPIFKIQEQSLNRFGKMAADAKGRLEAFENREHDDVPPIAEPYDGGMEYEAPGNRRQDDTWGRY